MTGRCVVQGPVLSLEEIPEIPSELAGIWAYIMWESAGCPQRSQDAADREYREGIAELQQCLCRGKTLDELWEVRPCLLLHSCQGDRARCPLAALHMDMCACALHVV